MDLLAATSWMVLARCENSDQPEVFFPTDKGPAIAAKAICGPCPVRDRCLDYALRNEISDGVWGGKTSYERARMRRVALAA